MKKLTKFIVSILALMLSLPTFARHLKGGWIQYIYLGSDAATKTSQYRIIIRQYLSCESTGPQIDDNATLGVFDAGTNQRFMVVNIDSVFNGSVVMRKKSFNACVNPKPDVCYLINKYDGIITLPDNDDGYILAVQRCCRINGIVNILNSGDIGVTYYNRIPGKINGVVYRNNSSPAFAQKDTALICYSDKFEFDFSAIDSDKGDSLAYRFCDGLQGGTNANTSGTNGIGPKPTSPSYPPYTTIPYNSPDYFGSTPLGGSVNIDPVTGLISGIAPPTIGDYVVAVCVLEYRNGVLIGSTKKEIHITVANCSIDPAKLKPAYINCQDLNFSFFNESSATNITSYLWNFGDPASGNTVSTSPAPTHVYSDTGVYLLKLSVKTTTGCEDSTTAPVRVFPGFKAGFAIQGTCYQNPYKFIDSTFSQYGYPNKWLWDFGEPSTNADTAYSRDTSYLYPFPGSKNVRLIVSSTKGCTDTLEKILNVLDKPDLKLAFKDTLICFLDTLQLIARGMGSFSWASSPTLLQPNSPTPFVYPRDTTTYYVTMRDYGCVNSDSVVVNVLKEITVDARPDTLACLGDSITLRAYSDGLSYVWESTNPFEQVAPLKTPWVKPSVNPTGYYVTAILGKRCRARDAVIVNVYPKPLAIAGEDLVLCQGDSARLSAKASGERIFWAPTNVFLTKDSTSLAPWAKPDTTTEFVLTSYYLKSPKCPVIAKDTMRARVIPKIYVKAMNDTTVTVLQPMRFSVETNADTLLSKFEWNPASWLDDPKKKSPTAYFRDNNGLVTYTVRATTPEGCWGTDTVKVLVYNILPDILVPTGFTPNGDGKNDIEKPIPIGMYNITGFWVYNRLGRLLYHTDKIGEGWDGTLNGTPQPSGTYVFIATGIDYLGKKVEKKGTFVLIR